MTPTAHVPLLSVALHPHTYADRTRLRRGLRQLMSEDHSLSAAFNPETGITIIATSGERQLEVVIDRLKREFGIEAGIGRPTVICRESLSRSAEAECLHMERSGEGFASVRIGVDRGKTGTGIVFNNLTRDLPTHLVNAVRAGVEYACSQGVLAGHPIVNVTVDLRHASYHPTASSSQPFTVAAARAFREAALKAAPVVLEPIMQVETVVSAESATAVIDNLVARRGQMVRSEAHEDEHTTTIRALVPLAQLFGFDYHLQRLTRREPRYSLQLDAYQPVDTEPEPGTDSAGMLPVGVP